MKRIYTPVHATTPIPLEAFRTLLGIPEPPPKPEPPSPPKKITGTHPFSERPPYAHPVHEPGPPPEYRVLVESRPPQKNEPRPGHIINGPIEYDGSIDLDLWLNLPDTTWNRAKIVYRRLSHAPETAKQFLEDLGMVADPYTAGLLCGKVMSMKAICLFREIYIHLQNNPGLGSDAIEPLTSQLLHFLQLNRHNASFAKAFHTAALRSESIEECEVQLFSTFMPVNSYRVARKIFKSRVKRNVLTDFVDLMRNKELNRDFALGYLLGLLSRLYFLDPGNPILDEHRLNPLRKVIRFYQNIVAEELLFVRDTLPLVINRFLTMRPLRPEPLLALYAFQVIYRLAMRDTVFKALIERLQAFEKEMDVQIYFKPAKLAEVYQAIPFFDLEWANRELGEVVFVKCRNK